MLLVVLKNVLCVVADGLSKNVDFFITMKKQFTWKRFRFPIC